MNNNYFYCRPPEIILEVGRIKLVNILFFKRINNISTPEDHFSTQYKFDYHPALIKTQ